MQTEIYFTNLADLKMPVAIVTGGNKGIGLGVVRNIKCSFKSFSEVRGLCKQFKGEVYLTARDEARGKVKSPFVKIILLANCVAHLNVGCWEERHHSCNPDTTAQAQSLFRLEL